MMPPESATLQRTWYVAHTPVLRLSLSLPHLNSEHKKARRFNRFYAFQQTAYVAYCQEVLFPLASATYTQCQETQTPFAPHSATMTHTITYQEGDLISLWTESKDETGQLRHGDTWHFATGFPVALGFFFPEQRGYKRLLAKVALAEIQRQEATGDAQYHPGLKLRTLIRRFNPGNFYRTQEGLVFFYQRYAIAPGVEGVPCFFYPLAL